MKWLISACSLSLSLVCVRSFVGLLASKASNPRFSQLTNMLRRDNQLILLLLSMKMVSHLNINELEFAFECSSPLSLSLSSLVRWNSHSRFKMIRSMAVSSTHRWRRQISNELEKKSRCTFLSFFVSLSPFAYFRCFDDQHQSTRSHRATSQHWTVQSTGHHQLFSFFPPSLSLSPLAPFCSFRMCRRKQYEMCDLAQGH